MSKLDRLAKKKKTKDIPATAPEGAVPLDESTFIMPKAEGALAPYQAEFLEKSRKKYGVGRFVKDQKSAMAYTIQYLSGEGEELIVHAFKILRGEATQEVWMPNEGGPVRVDRKPTFDEQAKAREWLANRGWGKEAQIIEMNVTTDDGGLDLSKLTTEEAAQYLMLQRKMRGPVEKDITPPNVVEGEIVSGKANE